MTLQFKKWDETRILAYGESTEETLDFCVDHFYETIQDSIKMRKRCGIALAGGATPSRIYRLLSASSKVNKIDWNAVHLFWSDERWVSHENPESNFYMAFHSGWDQIPIPSKNIHRMPTDGESYEEQAAFYEEFLKKEWPEGLDLILLGVGEDGHTASLFPGTKALDEKAHWVVANYIPQKACWRMTFTFEFIHLARHIVLYVLGESKAPIVKEAFEAPRGTFPVQNVGTLKTPALWILNPAALTSLLNIKK